MLCLKKRRTYSFTQGACNDIPRRSTKEKNGYNEALNMAVTTLPRKHRSREERSSGGMVLTVTEDTPADMLAGSMELLVQLPKDHNVHTQRVTVPRSTPMMDLLVQIATTHKLAASSYTLQAIGERGLVLPHQPNTPIGALDALQIKLLPKQGTVLPRKAKQANQPFETTFRLQVLLPRNQLYVSRVSPKMNLGKILDEVCREKNLDKNKYELRHPANLEETLDLSLSLQDYHLQEVTLYAKQGRSIGAALSSQDIMALQRQEERRRQQAKQSVFGFMFRKSKESSLSIDSLGGRSVSPARSDETGRSVSPLAPPARPQRKRRPAPKPPVQTSVSLGDEGNVDETKDKLVISHSRNSSDSSGYHEASVLSDNPDSGARMPETLPRRSKPPCAKSETSRKLAHTSESSKSLGNLAMASGGLSHGISSTSISSTGIRKKRAAPPPPIARPLSSAISSQALERIVDSEESLTSDIDISKSPSDIAASSKANSDIGVSSKANSDIGVHSFGSKQSSEIGFKIDSEFRAALAGHEEKISESDRRSAPEPPSPRFKPSLDIRLAKPEKTIVSSVEPPDRVESARVVKKGKLARSPSSIENNFPSYSFVSQSSLENVLELGEATNIGRETPRRDKHGSSTSTPCVRDRSRLDCPRSKSNSELTVSRHVIGSYGYTAGTEVSRKLQKSNSLVCREKSVRPNTLKTASLNGASEVESTLRGVYENSPFDYRDRIDSRLSVKGLQKIPTIADLEKIGYDSDIMPGCGILESRFSPSKPHCDNYICDERCRTKMLQHSLSFQSRNALRETKIVSSFESCSKSLATSRSFTSRVERSSVSPKKDRHDRDDRRAAPKLGDLRTTSYYGDAMISSYRFNDDSFDDCREDDYCDDSVDATPPPLSTLQIFAISTKPIDIQVSPIEEAIPNDIDKLPSLPILSRSGSKSGFDKKVSILEPPPPGLVSRQESNENWNQFLIQLNSILESRTETGPPIPKPRSIAASPIGACEPSFPVPPRRRLLEPTINHAKFFIPSEIDPSLKMNEVIDANEEPENDKVPSASADVELREKRAPVSYRRLNVDESSSKAFKTSSMIEIEARRSQPASALKHVKSLDDLYGVSMEFADEDISEENHSSARVSSCAVISTIPKCAHLTPKTDVDVSKTDSKKSSELIMNRAPVANSAPKRAKVFRSQSATNDFDVNPFEKHTRHFTSHPEDFTCAMNPNFSRSVLNVETDGTIDRNFETATSQPGEESEKASRARIEDYPPFVTAGTNLACEEDSSITIVEGTLAQRFVEHSAIGDRPTETDILLQKVSDTLSSSLPLSESSMPAAPKNSPEDIVTVQQEHAVKISAALSDAKDESDGVVESSENRRGSKEDSKPVMKDKETKRRESLLSDKNLVDASTPNATLNSQQDTSDYVSATGDDLSITDWEYQLPAPPSAFRDNVSPDFDGYDTITLRSVEAFKETVGEPRELEEHPVDSPLNESTIISTPAATSKEIKETPKPVTVQDAVENSRSQEAALTSQPTKPKFGSQTSSDSRSSEKSSELKKEIITELATKIENGSLSQTNGRPFEQDSRRTSADCAAPKIAPVDNTLSNFTITTYSRQKSLNIFEEEPVEERRSVPPVKSGEEKVERTFATLVRNKSSSQNYNGNVGSKNALNRAENACRSVEKQTVMGRAQSVEDVVASEIVNKKSDETIHFGQHDSLLRRPSLSNGHEKSTVVHRSKSYITLANNSKWRHSEDGGNVEANPRNEIDDCRILKSTSVTNLNQEAPRQNEKFSQWRENILKRQEEPTKEKQLQSLQVLKSILPQLKSSQQTEENVLDSSNRKDNSRDKCSSIQPKEDRIDSKSSQLEEITQTEAKPQKNVEEATTKRYKYTGPPAISLGSWSERPRVNVQLKMDTDYKFGTNNISGSKTVVSLNGKSDERQSKDNSKSVATNGVSTMNGTAARNETSQIRRRDSEEELAKKLITHTTASGFKKPTLNRIGYQESKNDHHFEDKPIVTSVALKKTHMERSDSRVERQQRRDVNDDDDEKIDTKPVSFKELTKTFGQEVCLRTNPKRVLQNRHSDYYGTRSDVLQTFSSSRNGQNGLLKNDVTNTRNYGASNGVQRDAAVRPTVKRYTSVVGIQSQNNSHATENGDTIAKSHTATMKMNGLMPVVKGFKIQVGQNETRANGVSVVGNSKRNSNVPPAPPTMPIITGVTLKNSTARPKSMPICNADPRDQLLESIRSFGGRDKLKNVNTFS